MLKASKPSPLRRTPNTSSLYKAFPQMNNDKSRDETESEYSHLASPPEKVSNFAKDPKIILEKFQNGLSGSSTDQSKQRLLGFKRALNDTQFRQLLNLSAISKTSSSKNVNLSTRINKLFEVPVKNVTSPKYLKSQRTIEEVINQRNIQKPLSVLKKSPTKV